MKKQFLIITLILLIITSCANKNIDGGVTNQQVVEEYPVQINVTSRKGKKAEVSIKAPNLEQSTELDSIDNLADFYAQHKSEIERSSDTIITLSTETPIAFDKYSEITNSARKAGLDTFYLKELFGEKRIFGKNLQDSKTDTAFPDYERFRSLILVVDWTKDGKIKLNNDEQGSIEDLSRLEARLIQIFQDRSQFPDTFREGTNQPETAVYIRIPKDTTPFDLNLEKLIETLKKAGASPIGIQTGKN